MSILLAVFPKSPKDISIRFDHFDMKKLQLPRTKEKLNCQVVTFHLEMSSPSDNSSKKPSTNVWNLALLNRTFFETQPPNRCKVPTPNYVEALRFCLGTSFSISHSYTLKSFWLKFPSNQRLKKKNFSGKSIDRNALKQLDFEYQFHLKGLADIIVFNI